MNDEQKRLSRKYLTYKMLISLWFMGATWLYFYRLYITDQQVGILDGVAFAIGLLAEVPSGALADKFGRARMVKIGQFLAGSGVLIQAFGDTFIQFFIGQSVMMIGVSFVSGADDALFFAKLNFNRASSDWRNLTTRATQVSLMSTLFAIIAGGWFYTVDPRLPWILCGLAFISSALVIWSIKDTYAEKTKQTFLAELKSYFVDIKIGFAQFVRPELRLYIPIIILVEGLYYTASWGLLRLVLLDRFHFSPILGSIVIAVSILVTAGILGMMHRFSERLSERHVIGVIAFTACIGLLLSIPDIGMWGAFVILAFYAGQHCLHPFMSDALNKHAPESHRATVLSVASFFQTLPYVVLAPIIGYMNTHNALEYFLASWAVLIVFAIIAYLWLKANLSPCQT